MQKIDLSGLREELKGLRKMDLRSPLSKVLYVAGVTTFCTFLGCWAVLAHQENTQGTRTNAAVVSDEQFARNAAQGGMAEVKLGQLAQEKGTSEGVKRFGQRMVQDHKKANEELTKAAKRDGIALPSELNAKDEATFEELSQLSGAAFDRAYARDMVKDHWEDVSEFSREANGGQKRAIKKFAVETLPTLNDHLKEAREMRQSVASSSATPPATKNSSGHGGRR